MMAKTAAPSQLHVEGSDDKHTIIHLLKRHGIEYPQTPHAPEIKSAEGVEKLLAGIEPAVELATGRATGWVLDADDAPGDRWAAVRGILTKAGVPDVPKDPPAGGFIGASTRYKSRVGVWLMPDNKQAGTLERFLEELVPTEDRLYEFAETSTDQAKALGAPYADKDRLKAVLHAWLAWQAKPGLGFGTAMNNKYFDHDHPNAITFVTWYKELFEIS